MRQMPWRRWSTIIGFWILGLGLGLTSLGIEGCAPLFLSGAAYGAGWTLFAVWWRELQPEEAFN